MKCVQKGTSKADGRLNTHWNSNSNIHHHHHHHHLLLLLLEPSLPPQHFSFVTSKSCLHWPLV